MEFSFDAKVLLASYSTVEGLKTQITLVKKLIVSQHCYNFVIKLITGLLRYNYKYTHDNCIIQ